MVTVRVSFEDLLKAIDNLSEEQKQIIRGRLLVTPAPTSDLDETVETRLRQYRVKLYARARHYWESVGDTSRLALTDAELDEQFWLFDGEEIPRLKEDEGKIEVPETSMTRLLKLAEKSPIDFDDSYSRVDPDSIIENEFGDYLWERMQSEHGTEENPR